MELQPNSTGVRALSSAPRWHGHLSLLTSLIDWFLALWVYKRFLSVARNQTTSLIASLRVSAPVRNVRINLSVGCTLLWKRCSITNWRLKHGLYTYWQLKSCHWRWGRYSAQLKCLLPIVALSPERCVGLSLVGEGGTRIGDKRQCYIWYTSRRPVPCHRSLQSPHGKWRNVCSRIIVEN